MVKKMTSTSTYIRNPLPITIHTHNPKREKEKKKTKRASFLEIVPRSSIRCRPLGLSQTKGIITEKILGVRET